MDALDKKMSFLKNFKLKSNRHFPDTEQHYADAEQQDYSSKSFSAELCKSCCSLIKTVTTTRVELNKPSSLCKHYNTLSELVYSRCRLCQLIGGLKTEGIEGYRGLVKLQSIYNLNPDSADYDYLKSGPLLVFQTGDIFCRFRGIGTFGVIHSMFDKDDLKPRCIEPLAVNGSLLREWLGFCKKNHHDTCRPVFGRKVARFQVLDCRTRRVIRPDLGCKYVALSYTWGLGISEHSHDSFPRTIEDSILVTLELGFRYLWIDKYCIDQTDADEKHTQIQQMDVIYSMADLTIVAAAGNSPDYGLPGVSTRARKAQKRIVLGAVQLLQIYSDSEDLRLSSWASRAWTLQEGYLAKRRLIFTDREVLFLCEHMYCQESVHQKLRHRTHRGVGSWDGLDGTHLFSVIPNRNWEGFKADRILTEYSRRTLSFDADALNACLGILKATKISHWFGIPIELDGCAGRQRYTLNLQWRIDANDITRSHPRPGFPSWSWTSVGGPKTFPEYKSQFVDDCTISVQNSNDEWLTIDEWMESGGDSALLKNSHCLRVYAYVWKLNVVTYPIIYDHRFAMSAGPFDFGFDYQLDLEVEDVISFLSDGVILVLQFSRDGLPRTSAVALILKPFGDRYRRVGITDWDSRTQYSDAQFEVVDAEKQTLFVE